MCFFFGLEIVKKIKATFKDSQFINQNNKIMDIIFHQNCIEHCYP